MDLHKYFKKSYFLHICTIKMKFRTLIYLNQIQNICKYTNLWTGTLDQRALHLSNGSGAKDCFRLFQSTLSKVYVAKSYTPGL